MRMFFIHMGGRQQGPYYETTLRRMNLPDNTPVWCKGMQSWAPIAQVLTAPQRQAPQQPMRQSPRHQIQTMQQVQPQALHQPAPDYAASTDRQSYQQQSSGNGAAVPTHAMGRSENLGLWGYYKKCWRNYATFAGRARRKEYWGFALFNFLFPIGLFFAGILITALLMFISTGEAAGLLLAVPLFMPIFSILCFIYSLAVFIPGLAVVSRRLHDTGKGFGYFFLVLIPVIGAIILLVFFCIDSEPQQNRFGPNPKTGA